MSEPMTAFVRPRNRRGPQATVETTARITETTGVRKAPPKLVADVSDTLRSDQNWSAADLQSYVLRQIESMFGPQPDHSFAPKMTAIFKRFHGTWGADAARIARYVFETQSRPGYWKGAPVKATRFTKGNDQYFAQAVLDLLDR